jgi:hypothetical protein
MTKRMGWLSVYEFTERKGGATRYRWRLYGADGAVLARSESSFSSHGAAESAARRVSGLLTSVFTLIDRRRPKAA